jgi:DNA-binding transcriptional ArsR family regulator
MSESAASLDAIAAGLTGFGHPLRIRLMVLMDDGEWRPSDLAEALGESLGVTSYHVRMARDYGLVEMTRTEPRRGALAHFYRRTELADSLISTLSESLSLPAPRRGRSGPKRRDDLIAWARDRANGEQAAA